MARPDEEIDRFFDQVEYGAEWNGSLCLTWKGPQGGNNKPPTFGLDGRKRVDAIRYAYALEHGERYMRDGYEVLHRCGDTMCVNFLHLMVVETVKHTDAVPDEELRRADWCRNGLHMRADYEKLDTYGRRYCSGCAENADLRRRQRERREAISAGKWPAKTGRKPKRF